MIVQTPHPLLYARAFRTDFSVPLGKFTDDDLKEVRSYFSLNCQTPLTSRDTKKQIRDLLRHGGFSPSGRNKPAHEYLHKAIEKGWFSKEKGINAAVDVCNVVSLHSSLPISVIDCSKVVEPLKITCCVKGTQYPFNPSGQILKADGLLAMCDSSGPSASPVKDSQRSKTDERTSQTLSIIWGHAELKSHVDETHAWYQDLLSSIGAKTVEMAIQIKCEP
jgi:DNA/RNA-binding domain of Phe-tRNA-synthetase-like protein